MTGPGAAPEEKRLVIAVVSPASLGSQAAHEVERTVGAVAEVVRTRSLAELLAMAGREDPPLGTVALIVATDEVGSLDDVAATVERYPSLATARLVLLTERTELHDIGRAIDEDLVREVVAVPWTPGAVGHRAAAQTRRWMRDHLPDDDRRHRLGADDGEPAAGRAELLTALTHDTDTLTRELVEALEQVLGPRPRLRVPADVRLTHEGQVVDSVYVVLEGRVALTRETRVGEVVLHHATTGRIIGLVSLASHGRAYVTSTTTTEVELILLSVEQLDRALKENPATEQTLAALIIGSLTTRLSRSEILQVEKIELAAAVEAQRAQAEEALAALEQARLELLAQERFATLGELAAGVAHELNNPVAALRRAEDHLGEAVAAILETHPDGAAIAQAARDARERPGASTRQERADRRYLEGVVGDRDLARRLAAVGLGEGTGPAEVRALAADRQRLALIEAGTAIGREQRNTDVATNRIGALVASLSTYVRPEGEEDIDIDVREVLEDALRLTAHRLEGVRVEREYGRDTPLIRGRVGELAQVWTNLLSNSADALTAAGTPQPQVRLVVEPAGEGTAAVRVVVEDNGPGIDPEILPRIFEPRFTTRHGQVRFGLGLGMGLARSVVDAHGGTIDVESRPGLTRVTVLLPTESPVKEQP